MRKRRREQHRVKMERTRKRLWRHVRLQKVLAGLKCNLSIKEIHYKTRMSEKTIRKIMEENPEEITFFLLTRQMENKK